MILVSSPIFIPRKTINDFHILLQYYLHHSTDDLTMYWSRNALWDKATMIITQVHVLHEHQYLT